jgi:3-dehydroquinate synthase
MVHGQIDVRLGERSYPIFVGNGMLADLAPTMQQRGLSGRVLIITDKNVAALYLKQAEKHLRHFGFDTHSIVIPSGEAQKSLSRAHRIFTEMLKTNIDRNSVVVALGGGVVGDLAGFIAATYQRGIPLVQVPTTLLAQVDSSVGGKVAVNHPLGKNMIGAFHQPVMVWSDSGALSTLPQREIVCGLGEIVKYGIALDADLFGYLEDSLDDILKLRTEQLLHVQFRWLDLKASIVSHDERESGLRSILNLGHTVGHAIEAAGRYRMFKHGEAILLGMVAEGYIAGEMGLIDADVRARMERLIARVPLRVRAEALKLPEILNAMKHDKKSVNKKVRFVLPTRIGEARVVDGVNPKIVLASLKYLNAWKPRAGHFS